MGQVRVHWLCLIDVLVNLHVLVNVLDQTNCEAYGAY